VLSLSFTCLGLLPERQGQVQADHNNSRLRHAIVENDRAPLLNRDGQVENEASYLYKALHLRYKGGVLREV
jgi:hypothetical protein